MLNPEIRDQAYQFFVEEAPELLEAIESGLLALRENRSTAKVHEVMRAAHSIKGGAASVELEVIKVIAHRLEAIFKALYDETVEIDPTLEQQLLQAYDCLRLPLMEQIETGSIDIEQALVAAEPVFTQLEERLAEALLQADGYIPTSSDLGVDMVASIFEIDVAQGIERLRTVVQQPSAYPIAGELQAQAEVFTGLAELLNLPGFGKIAQTALTALEVNPDQALKVLRLALADFEMGRAAVLQGDRCQGGAPSAELTALTQFMNHSDTATPSSTRSLETYSSALEHIFAMDGADGLLLESGLDDLPDFSELISINAESDLENSDFENSDFGNTEVKAPLSKASEENEFLPNLADIFESSEDTFISTEQLEQENDLEIEQIIIEEYDQVLELVADESIAAEDIFTNNLEMWSTEDEQLEQLEHGPLEYKKFVDDAPLSGLTTEEIAADFDAPPVVKSAKILVEKTLAAEIAVDRSNSTEITGDELSPSQTASTMSIEDAIHAAEQLFDQLPSLGEQPDAPPATPTLVAPEDETAWKQYLRPSPVPAAAAATPANLSVRVDLHRLEQMNNLVGELAINRNSLSLQNEQLQSSVRDLVERFDQFQTLIGGLRDLSDRMLVAPENRRPSRQVHRLEQTRSATHGSTLLDSFDSLEMDRYSGLHLQLQEIFEQAMQLEEVMGDVGLFAGQSNQTLVEQRQKLTQLQNELMWARMLPLGNVLNRFPRVLRDLSTKYNKLVSLKLNGTGVLVDKMVLEKLYDPLLHLLRNAFDHGIEMPEDRQQQGKPPQGTIEIRAYHRGNQTLIDIADDGKGLNIQRIGRRAVELGWLSTEELVTAKPAQLLNFIFEPGFSTASQVSELSGRGVGLDVVRAQLRSLKGSVTVDSTPGQGTIFTLRIPLTLTIAKLLTCNVGTHALAIPSDSIEEILVPKPEQIKHSGSHQFLYWHEQLVPMYRMSHLLNYACAMPESAPSDMFITTPTPKEWASPLLIIRRAQHSFALEVDRLVTEQELVIKPFGLAISPPAYTYGCTILGDGSLVPVIDAGTLVDLSVGAAQTGMAQDTIDMTQMDVTQMGITQMDVTQMDMAQTMPLIPYSVRPPAEIAPLSIRPVKTILVVDDAATLRRMLALTLEKAGYRVLQARDGQEALTQLQQGSSVQLVICDIEMPNMNGFEFLSQRRQNLTFAAIPVVMLTSRSNDKHRRLAMHLGATEYFSKPYIEHDLLRALKHLLEVSVPVS